MAFKTVLFVVLLVGGPSAWGQSVPPEKSDQDESQVPAFLDQHEMKVIASFLRDQGNADQTAAGQTTQVSVDKETDENNEVTIEPEPEKHSDVTDAPIEPVKAVPEQQVPIFLNQHMFKVVANSMEQKDDTKEAEVGEVTTPIEVVIDNKPEEHQQMPIFLNQHIVKEIADMHDSKPKPPKINNGNHGNNMEPPTINIPEPKEHYTNSIVLERHHLATNWQQNIMNLVSAALLQEKASMQSEMMAYPLATRNEYTSTGVAVATVEYVVMYNGRVLAEYEVTRTLSRPRPSQYLHNGLHHMHMRKYTDQAQTQSAETTTTSNVSPVLIAVLTVASTIIVLYVVVVVVVIRRNKKNRPPKRKDKKELMKYILKADKRKPSPVEPLKPPPYSENPAFEA